MVGLKQGSSLRSGKYKIIKTLGQGSFGITYLAATRVSMVGQLGKLDVNVNVTIKEFFMSDLNSRATDGTNVERTNSTIVKNYLNKFRREAENLAKLHHSNIVKVLEVFDENNTTYYVMEYVDGETIDEYIKSKGHLSESESLKITQDLCTALSYMHEHKMLHLDLKPKNIMRDTEGHIYLIDFGLAKQYNDNGEPESSTTLGLGTPGYAPIEQAHYKQDGTFPVTLDIYAVGASLYKMLTGKTPPESSYVLNDGLPHDALTRAGVHEHIIAIVEKAMSPILKDRYQTITDLSKAISQFLSSHNEQTEINEDEEGTTIEIGSRTKRKPYSQTLVTKEKSEKPKENKYNNGESSSLEKYWKYGLSTAIVLLCIYLCFNWNNSSSTSQNDTSVADTVAVTASTLIQLNSPITQNNNIVKHIAIDLGLPSGTLWSNCNLGAKSEMEDGEQYAFGTIVSKDDYPENTGEQFADGESIIGTPNDVAFIKLGSGWQLPSMKQMQELIEKCRFVIRSNGYDVIGPNGNKLFLPYTRGDGNIGYYWSGNKGCVLEFQPGYKKLNEDDEAFLSTNFASYCSLSIRPVKK